MQTCSSVTEGLRLLTSRVRSRALCSLGNTTPALCACGPCSGQYARVRTQGLQRCQCYAVFMAHTLHQRGAQQQNIKKGG